MQKPKKNSYTEWRNYTTVAFLLATGCRLNTIINIKTEDLDFENECIYLRVTKNKKQQIMPMSGSLKTALKKYLSLWEQDEDTYLLVSQYGQQLTRDGFKNIIKKYNISKGVSKTGVHQFRHTFAKNWILNGGDIFRLQKLLGHSSMDMVRKYVNMFDSDLQCDFDIFNPLEKLIKKSIKLR